MGVSASGGLSAEHAAIVAVIVAPLRREPPGVPRRLPGDQTRRGPHVCSAGGVPESPKRQGRRRASLFQECEQEVAKRSTSRLLSTAATAFARTCSTSSRVRSTTGSITPRIAASSGFPDAPILVLYGADTPPKSLAEMEALAGVPGIDAHRLAAGSLGLHEENPDAAAEVLRPFLLGPAHSGSSRRRGRGLAP